MRRRLFWFLLALLPVVLLLSMGMGAVPLSLVKALQGDPMTMAILLKLRLPRTLAGALVGAQLAVAGGMLQAVTRNPLADPHIVGVSAGAGLAAVTVFLAVPGFPMALLPLAALAGGVLAGAIVYLAAWKGGVAAGRLALAGVAVSALLTAATSALLLRYSMTANAALVWLAGGLWGRNWDHVAALAPWAVPALAAAWLLGPRVDLLTLGDDVARGLGMHVEQQRGLILLLAVLLAASAVAVSGPIGFVGLVVPHIARMLAGGRFRLLMPVAALLGASLVVLADALGRTLFAPNELPAGVITALVGAPYFLYLLRRAAL
jgi:ABC-type Fe3+-siderophore transport system permease subunit